MREPVSKSEWIDWKYHPVTRALVHDLNALRETYKEQWAEDKWPDQEDHIKGLVQGLRDVLEYISRDFDITGDDKDELQSD